MTNNINYMRSHRKKTALTLLDIANLLGLKDKSYVGRIENGLRPPTIEILLLYNLLFDAPIDELFITQKQDITQKLLANGDTLIRKLQEIPESHNSLARIIFLQSVITRITGLETYEG